MPTKHLTHAEAVRRFLRDTGMSSSRMHRARITLKRCTCGLDCCNGWLAVGAWLNHDGTPKRVS